MKLNALKLTALTLASTAALLAAPAHAGKDLDAVKKRGELNCGVNTGLPGFSAADSQGKWTGMDVDLCRSVAAAVLGNPDKVRYVPLTAQQRFTALQSGEIDVLARNTTWTLTRDASLGLTFVGVNFYDGQGFMVPKKLGVKSAKELDGASICVLTGSTSELNIADFREAEADPLRRLLAQHWLPPCAGLFRTAAVTTARATDDAHRGEALSLYYLHTSLSMAIGPPLALWLRGHGGMPAGFVTVSVLAGAILLLVFSFPPDAVAPPASAPRPAACWSRSSAPSSSGSSSA